MGAVSIKAKGDRNEVNRDIRRQTGDAAIVRAVETVVQLFAPAGGPFDVQADLTVDENGGQLAVRVARLPEPVPENETEAQRIAREDREARAVAVWREASDAAVKNVEGAAKAAERPAAQEQPAG